MRQKIENDKRSRDIARTHEKKLTKSQKGQEKSRESERGMRRLGLKRDM
jgi:hypothetical protein